jgi:outer membrane protein
MSRHSLRASILTASLGLAAVLPAHAAAAAAAPAAPAAAPARRTINMTLNEAVDLALNKGFAKLAQDLSLANSKESYISAKLEYRPTMSITSALNQNQNGATGSSTGRSDHVDSQSLSASISQKIPTGATVSLTSTILSRANTANSPTTPSYGRSLTLSVSQPLLRGAGTKYNLNNLRKSKITLDQSYLSYKTFLISTVTSVESAYIALINARQNLDIATQSLALAKQVYDEQVTRNQAGLVTPLNLYSAENTYVGSQNTLEQRKLALSQAEDSLRQILGGGDFDIGIVPTDDLATESMNEDDFTVEKSYRLTLDRGVDYQNRKTAVQTAEWDLDVAKNNLKPSLSLTGSVTSSDSGVSTWGSSYHKLSESQNLGWSIGVSLSVPLGERNDRISYRRALNSLQSAKLSLAQYELDTLVSVRSAVNSIANQIRTVRLTTRQAELSRLTYEAEKQRFDVGQSTIRSLNQALNDLDSARFNLVSAKLTLRTQINNLRRTENTTLDRYPNIKMPE